MKPSDRIDTAKLVRQPPDGVNKNLKLRAAADRLITRTSLYLQDHPIVVLTASDREVKRRVLLRSAILEVRKCMDR